MLINVYFSTVIQKKRIVSSGHCPKIEAILTLSLNLILVNGQWAEWSGYPACSAICGGGIQTRTRTCSNPAPANEGLDCPGMPTECRTCNTGICRRRYQRLLSMAFEKTKLLLWSIVNYATFSTSKAYIQGLGLMIQLKLFVQIKVIAKTQARSKRHYHLKSLLEKAFQSHLKV